MPEKWIKDESRSAVVLATLIDGYLADLEESEFENEDLTALSRRQLSEAVEEFYALNPHLGENRIRMPKQVTSDAGA